MTKFVLTGMLGAVALVALSACAPHRPHYGEHHQAVHTGYMEGETYAPVYHKEYDGRYQPEHGLATGWDRAFQAHLNDALEATDMGDIKSWQFSGADYRFQATGKTYIDNAHAMVCREGVLSWKGRNYLTGRLHETTFCRTPFKGDWVPLAS